jgi:S1-C subfamily serine protease
MNMRIGSVIRKSFLVGLLGLSTVLFTYAQAPVGVPTSVNSALVIDAAGPEQRKSLNAIYLIACPDSGFGSGFLLDSGLVVTNVHVVDTCTEQTLVGISHRE